MIDIQKTIQIKFANTYSNIMIIIKLAIDLCTHSFTKIVNMLVNCETHH